MRSSLLAPRMDGRNRHHCSVGSRRHHLPRRAQEPHASCVVPPSTSLHACCYCCCKYARLFLSYASHLAPRRINRSSLASWRRRFGVCRLPHFCLELATALVVESSSGLGKERLEKCLRSERVHGWCLTHLRLPHFYYRKGSVLTYYFFFL